MNVNKNGTNLFLFSECKVNGTIYQDIKNVCSTHTWPDYFGKSGHLSQTRRNVIRYYQTHPLQIAFELCLDSCPDIMWHGDLLTIMG